MQYRLRKSVRGQVAVLAFLGLCSYQQVFGQTIASKLDETGEFNCESTTLSGQLEEFAHSYKIPMGIELVAGNDKALEPMHVKKDTALNVLRKILQQRPGYDFDLCDGVVNVYSTKLINDPKNFLNLRLRRYQITDQNLFGAKYYLKLAINQMLHPSSNYGGGYGGVGLNNDLHVVKTTFSGENLTVRQILNRLILMQGGSFWIVRLIPSEQMSRDPFYSQALSTTDTTAASEFFWEFVSLNRK